MKETKCVLQVQSSKHHGRLTQLHPEKQEGKSKQKSQSQGVKRVSKQEGTERRGRVDPTAQADKGFRQEDRNGMDLTEAEDIKKRWQEYTEELYRKDLHDPDNHDGVITHLEPDILECEVKWALGSIITNKSSGGDGIPVELFQILKDDAVKVLHAICQQIWKTQQWPQDWKRSVFIPIPKKGNPKECSNYRTIALISHVSNAPNSPSQASTVHEPWTSRCSNWF